MDGSSLEAGTSPCPPSTREEREGGWGLLSEVGASPRRGQGGPRPAGQVGEPGRGRRSILSPQKTPRVYSVELHGAQDVQKVDRAGGRDKHRGLQDSCPQPRKTHGREEPKKDLDLVSADRAPRGWGCPPLELVAVTRLLQKGSQDKL